MLQRVVFAVHPPFFLFFPLFLSFLLFPVPLLPVFSFVFRAKRGKQKEGAGKFTLFARIGW